MEEGVLPHIFGIGLSKTGTSSLAEALIILGISTMHFPHDETTQRELRSGEFKLSILKSYRSIVDSPIAPHYADFDRLYPGSKFILTVRDKQSWLRSMYTSFRWRELFLQIHPEWREYMDFVDYTAYGTTTVNKEKFSDAYERHQCGVETHFHDRHQDLLILNITAGEGWNKVCPFLGLAPPDRPFPHANPANRGTFEMAINMAPGGW